MTSRRLDAFSLTPHIVSVMVYDRQVRIPSFIVFLLTSATSHPPIHRPSLLARPISLPVLTSNGKMFHATTGECCSRVTILTTTQPTSHGPENPPLLVLGLHAALFMVCPRVLPLWGSQHDLVRVHVHR